MLLVLNVNEILKYIYYYYLIALMITCDMNYLDDGQLIELVRQYPSIFDKSLADFKNKSVKQNAWTTISAIIGHPVEDCEQRWTVLRNRYVTEARTMKYAPSGSAATPVWQYFTQMQFLDKHIVPRRTKGNMKPQQIISPAENQVETEMSEAESVWSTQLFKDTEEDIEGNSRKQMQETEGTSCSTNQDEEYRTRTKKVVTNQRKRKSKDESLITTMTGTLGTLDKYISGVCTQNKVEHEDIHFGKSIGLLLQKINSKKKQIIIKRKILEIFEELSESDID